MARFSLVPRNEQFFDDFVRLAEEIRKGARSLKQMLSTDAPDMAHVDLIKETEHTCDGMTRSIIDRLNRTFVTPLDREDIYNLSESFEKMAIYACTTLEEMHLLRVAPDGTIRDMVGLIHEQAEELHEAMQRLSKNPRVASDHANRIHDKEREVERLYRAGIRDLFAGASDPAALPGILYRREVYRHISNMADRAVSAANVLGMVVMKIA